MRNLDRVLRTGCIARSPRAVVRTPKLQTRQWPRSMLGAVKSAITLPNPGRSRDVITEKHQLSNHKHIIEHVSHKP